MEKRQKGSDWRLLFSADFKHEDVGRVTSGEIGVAELSRELGRQPSLLRHWKRRINEGARVIGSAIQDVVPIAELERIGALGRAVARRTKEVESLKGARDEERRTRWYADCPASPADRQRVMSK